MPPTGLGKRKRGDRTYSHEGRDEGQRPSPHRPGDLNMGQYSTEPVAQQSSNSSRGDLESRGLGRRRGGAGGRGGYGAGPQRSPVTAPNHPFPQARPGHTPAEGPSVASTTENALPENKSTASGPVQNTPSIANHVQPAQTKSDAINTANYCYEYLSVLRLETWNETGREELVRLGIEARKKNDGLILGGLFQELIQASLSGHLDPLRAGSVLKEILQPDSQGTQDPFENAADEPFDAASLFLDTLSIVAEYHSATPDLVSLVTSTGISPQKMRRELDSALLENLGLVRKNIFVRVGIRQQTNLLYRQSNYNLLREETEGYSKLVTDLFTTSSDEPPTSENVEETFERVKGMIGAFDLDVGRVLDISLDVFATVLVKQYRFFVKYFRASSWWPHQRYDARKQTDSRLGPLPRWALPGAVARTLSDEEKGEIKTLRTRRDEAFWSRARDIGMAAYFELGGRHTAQSSPDKTLDEAVDSDATDSEETRNWIKITKTLPPAGNKVAAQVLGFKLRFYNSSARDTSDTLPLNLIYLAALLVKIGFVSLKDLYPHIWPEDDAMENVRQEKMKEKAAREKLNLPGGGAPNALLLAAPLPDDTVDAPGREAIRLRETETAKRQAPKSNPATDRSTPVPHLEPKADELPEPSEQKVQLLKSLLTVGAIPEALYMLGRFPWLPEAFPDLPEYIHRILHHCVNKVYDSLCPRSEQGFLQEQQWFPDTDQSGVQKNYVRLVEGPSRKRKRWAQLDQDNVNEKDEVVDYRFYWDDWADAIPVCQSIDDVFTLCSTFMNLSGVKIGQDPQLHMKLARIGSRSLATDQSSFNISRWVDLSKRLLVPALSFTKCNPGAVHEVFELIKHFPYPTRYGIYAEWQSGQVSRQQDIKSAFVQAEAETRDVLKRMSKTTIKPTARALAKVAYASPGVVFSVAIRQLESYENIVDVVVECARYLTYMAYDVLTWSLLSALGEPDRQRVQSNGMLTSKWLAALSLFAGKVFKRYSVMNPTPVVQYVAEQLRQANPTDLIVLEEIVKSMAGIISDTGFNEQQVLAMAGGDLLQAQTLLQLLDRRHESKTTAKRLMKSLTDSKLAGQVIVSLAQERQTCIFKIEENNAHPKLLGNLVDQLHRIFAQYTDLLRSNLSVKEFDQFVPSLVKLIADYGIDPNIAFWISRPSLVVAISEYDTIHGVQAPKIRPRVAKDLSIEGAVVEPGSIVKDAEMKDASPSAKDTEEGDMVPETIQVKSDGEDADMQDANGSAILADETSLAKVEEAAPEPWHPVLKETMLGIEKAMPKSTWEALSPAFFVTFWQCSLHDIFLPLQSYEGEINRQRKKVLAINADRSDLSIIGTQRKDKEKKALQELEDRLQTESKERLQHYTAVRRRLQKEKDHWFSAFWGKWDTLNIALIEQCFFPRMVLSAIDAKYAFNMLRYLHSSGAINFRTMGVYDQLFRDQRLTSMMFLCSAKESEYFGRFLSDVLQELGKWHSSKAIFEKEAYGLRKDLPGFSKKLSNEQTIISFWDYEDYRRILYKWHRNLSNALKTCLTSKEYMHIRNAINVLNSVHKNFPAVTFMGQHQVNCVTELAQNETREDLKIAAASLLGALKRREKDWVMPQAFHMVENAANSTAQRASSKSGTPKPEIEKGKPLNPNAREFEPKPEIKDDSASDKPAIKKGDAEDGEIDDAVSAKIKKDDQMALDGAQSDDPNTSANTTLSKNPQPDSDATEISATPEKRTTDVPNPASFAKQQTGIDQRQTGALNIAHSSVPLRPDLNRNASLGSATTRAQHELPSRPELAPNKAFENRYPIKAGERPPEYFRDTRVPDRLQNDASKDFGRERGNERPLPNAPQPHNPERLDARSRGLERERNDRYASDTVPNNRAYGDNRQLSSSYRDSRPPLRDDRPVMSTESRVNADQHRGRRDIQQTGEQQDRDNAMFPPRPAMPAHPDRAALISGDQEGGRFANGSRHSDRRPDTSRYTGEPPSHAEHSSRGPSPGRVHDRPPPHDTRRGDRRQDDGYRMGEENSYSRTRYEDSYPSNGPHADHPLSTAPSAIDRSRDNLRPPVSANSNHDQNHGRLNQDNSRGSWQNNESQYGRLNASHEAPTGPRLSNGNLQPSIRGAGRHMGHPSAHESHQQPSSLPSQVPPNASSAQPSLVRPPPQAGLRDSNQASFQNASNSQPPAAPNSGLDIGTIHPDRLKAIQRAGPNTGAGVSERGDSSRVPLNPPPLNVPPSNSARGPPPSPIQQSPVGRGGSQPSGPAFGGERNRDKRFAAGLQSVLQHSNGPPAPERSGQGTPIRGRGGRGPQTAPGPGVMPLHSPRDGRVSRDDLFAGRLNGPPPPSNVEDDGISIRNARRGPPEYDAPKEGERRSARHRSRSPKGDRSFEGPPNQQYRDRSDRASLRDDSREGPRDEAQSYNIRSNGLTEKDSRRPPEFADRDIRGGPTTRRSTRDMAGDGRGGQEAGYDRRGGGDERRDGGGSLRKRGRVGEEMNERLMDTKRPRR